MKFALDICDVTLPQLIELEKDFKDYLQITNFSKFNSVFDVRLKLNLDGKDREKTKSQVAMVVKFLEISLEQEFLPRKENEPTEIGAGEDPIESLEISSRTAKCLIRAKILSVNQLIQKNEFELFKIKGFGRISLNETKDALKDKGLSLIKSIQ